MQLRALSRGVASFVALILAAATAASASGTARVQQHDGTVDDYNNVTIRLVRDSVSVTNASKHDTLTFVHAACSFAGQLQRCLPYKIRLDRDGKDYDLAFKHGTVYMNLTSGMQQLPYSSKQLPPNGVLLSVQTARGTYITVKGTLDEVTR